MHGSTTAVLRACNAPLGYTSAWQPAGQFMSDRALQSRQPGSPWLTPSSQNTIPTKRPARSRWLSPCHRARRVHTRPCSSDLGARCPQYAHPATGRSAQLAAAALRPSARGGIRPSSAAPPRSRVSAIGACLVHWTSGPGSSTFLGVCTQCGSKCEALVCV